MLEEIDRPALKALPVEPYEFSEWRACRVGINYHVEADAHYYSVPHRFARADVDVRLTTRTVEVFLKGERIAAHMQSFLLTIYLRALCSSPPIEGEPNPPVGHMSAENWGFVVDGLRNRARASNMTLAELGSELVSFWADSRVQESATLRMRYLSFHDLLNEG